MKPKDLISPFKTKPKAVLLDRIEKIFYIPKRTERVQIDFDLKCLFQKSAPIHLEFCSGNGEWICEKAELHPEINWVALEMRFDRVQKIWSKMKNREIPNLFILCGEALDTATHYIPEGSIDQISVNFPDPWPKKRHAKHRLIQPPFLDQMARILKSDGQVDTLTDDPNYFEQIASTFVQHPSFTSLIPPPYYHSDIEDYGVSYFMKLWKEKKRSFYFSKFQNRVHR